MTAASFDAGGELDTPADWGDRNPYGGAGVRIRKARDTAIDAATRVRLGISRWPMRGSERFWGWVGPILLTLVSFWIRATGVTHPGFTKDPNSSAMIGYFDETYYGRDAHSLLLHGVELQGTASGQFVVHPPLGKWMIAVGEFFYGYTPLGIRISSVVIGSLTILVFTRFVRRVMRSTFLGMLGGLLLSLDALEFVQSRIGTLDIFLLFWIVCSTACLAADRDQGRIRLLDRLTRGTNGSLTKISASTGSVGIVAERTAVGPRLGWRWWRMAAGICMGCALATKWSAAPYLALYFFLAYAWDVGARRSAGVRKPGFGAFRRDTLPLLGSFVLLPVIVYLASWSGWFATSGGYDRHDTGKTGIIASLDDLYHYHKAALCFHEGLTNTPTKKDHFLCLVDESQCKNATPYDKPLNTYCYSTPSSHPYESKPFGWLVLARPVAYAYDGVKSGQSINGQKCTAVGQDCSREILAIDTPVLWWTGIACMIGCFFFWAAKRDWRAAYVLVGTAAGFFPWLQNTQRVMFQFYALPMLPFFVLAIVLTVAKVMAGPSLTRRYVASGLTGLFVLLVFADFVWLHPILAADVIPYSSWHARVVSILGFPNWI